MTNQSSIFNTQFEYEIIFKRIGTTRNFKMFYTYSSRTQWVMILV